MKRQQAKAVLNRFLEECGDSGPAQSDIEPVLDRVWERLERKADEFVDARVPTALAHPFRFVWAVGIVLAVVLVNGLIWSQGPPFSVAVRTGNAEPSLSKSSTEQAGETLQFTVPEDVFELASVKLLSPSSDAVKNANKTEAFQSVVSGCADGYVGGARVDPGRMTTPAITVFSLVMTAYGQDCTLVEGGPSWIRSGGDYYEIQALLPAGTPSYTQQDLQKGNAPRLQRMLQNLLADRFRLVLKREFREMSVYALTVASRGKMKLSPDQTPPDSSSPPTGMPFNAVLSAAMVPWGRIGATMSFSGETQLFGHAVSMSDLAKDLRRHAGRIVIDKTGLNGLFDFDLKFSGDPLPPIAGFPAAPPQLIPPPQSVPPLPEAKLPGQPPLRNALEEQLGLKLESARMPIEVLVIERVERPSEN